MACIQGADWPLFKNRKGPGITPAPIFIVASGATGLPITGALLESDPHRGDESHNAICKGFDPKSQSRVGGEARDPDEKHDEQVFRQGLAPAGTECFCWKVALEPHPNTPNCHKQH